MTHPTQNEDLVAGSVWQRNAKGKSTEVTVLLVTNTSLSEQLQEKFPPQVVFLREQGDVLSQTVDMFLSNRECIGVSESTANLIEVLLSAEGEEEEVDIDSIPLDDADGEGDDPDSDEAGPITEGAASMLAAIAGPGAEIPGDLGPVFEPAAVSLDEVTYDLDASFVGFRTVPFGSGNMVQVEFKLGAALTRQNLWDIFTDLGSFAIASEVERIAIEIAEVVSIEIGVSPNGAYAGTVYLETKPEIEAAPAAPIAVTFGAAPVDNAGIVVAAQGAPVVLQQVPGAPAAQLAVQAG